MMEGVYTANEGTVVNDYDAKQILSGLEESAKAQLNGESSRDEEDLESRLQSLNADVTEQVTEEDSETEQDVFVAQPQGFGLKTSELEQEKMSQLDALLQERYGLSVEDFESRNASLQDAELKQQSSSLQQEWGLSSTDFEARLSSVKQYFSKLPADMQDALDNPLGAKLIWSMIQSEQGAKKQVTPKHEKSTGSSKPANTSPGFVFTQSEILSMSPGLYSKYQSDILNAYALGKVDMTK